MKKNLCSLMLASLLSLSLCACKADTAQAQTQPFETDDVQALVEAGAFSEELETLDADLAFALYHLADYGLEREELLEGAVVRSAGATCEEAAVLIFAEEVQAAAAASALEDYLEAQIESNENYRPQEIPKLEEAVVYVMEETVMFVVAADQKAVEFTLS